MKKSEISEILNDRVVFRKDKDNWICVYDLFKKVLIRCSRFGREHVVPDTEEIKHSNVMLKVLLESEQKEIC